MRCFLINQEAVSSCVCRWGSWGPGTQVAGACAQQGGILCGAVVGTVWRHLLSGGGPRYLAKLSTSGSPSIPCAALRCAPVHDVRFCVDVVQHAQQGDDDLRGREPTAEPAGLSWRTKHTRCMPAAQPAMQLPCTGLWSTTTLPLHVHSPG